MLWNVFFEVRSYSARDEQKNERKSYYYRYKQVYWDRELSARVWNVRGMKLVFWAINESVDNSIISDIRPGSCTKSCPERRGRNDRIYLLWGAIYIGDDVSANKFVKNRRVSEAKREVKRRLSATHVYLTRHASGRCETQTTKAWLLRAKRISRTGGLRLN